MKKYVYVPDKNLEAHVTKETDTDVFYDWVIASEKYYSRGNVVSKITLARLIKDGIWRPKFANPTYSDLED